MLPSISWLTNWVLHEYNECWMYWSCLSTETDNRIKAIWELHLGMEIEHLRVACELMRKIEKVDPAEFLPAAGMPAPLTFETNKDYLRDVLTRTVDLTSFDAQFVNISDLPPDHRFFAHQRKVNEGGSPTEIVIDEHRARFGEEYRRATEGPHPVEPLREEGTHELFSYWESARANMAEGVA